MKNIVYVFVDASNLWQAQKVKGRFLNYDKIVKYIEKTFKTTKIKVFYYTAYPANGTRSYDLDSRHKFFTFLKKGLGFKVRKKELKRIKIVSGQSGVIREKGNMDVEITIDAMYYFREYDIAALFTGDSDFLALVAHLRAGGKKVYIFSSKNNISEELRTGADGYFDVLKIESDIWGGELQHRV
jgi:uncharacterized LabA/DUF88 family protein